MTQLEPFQLGLLVASTVLLGLLVLIGAITAGGVWAWLRAHERGELRWTKDGAGVSLERGKGPQQ